MNIATGILEAPVVKTAGVAELLELAAKGSIPKFLPEVMAKNQALMAGSGAISGDVVRRFLRARGAGNLASGTAGILAGLGTGGYAGGAGALASMAPALAGRTSDVAIPRILAATAGGAGIEHLIRMGIESNPGAIASGVGDAVKAIAAPVTRGVQGATAPISTNSAQELASSLGSKGLSELRGLVDSFSGGASNIGSQALSEAGDINLYKNLFGTGVAGAGILGGINHFKPGSAMATLNFLRNRSKPLLAGTAGAGLALAGAPTIGAAAMLGALGAPIVNSTGVRRAARGLYNMSPGGAVAAGLGGTAALLGAPVLAGGLGATALAYNPTFRRLSAGGANLGWSGLKGGANLGWSGLKGGANLGWSGAKGVGRGALATAKYTGALPGRAGRAFASIPSGYGIGGAGLAATMLGMPAVGVPAMLAAPFFNPKASAALGDIARTLNKSKATQNELNALYKTSSVKLAAPVFTTGASYILDAPVMTKEAIVGELVGAATRFLGERGTGLLEAGGNQLRKLRPHVTRGQFGFGGRARLLNRTTQQLHRGARESGQVLTEQAAKQRAEAFLRGPGNSEVTLNAPRGAWSDTGTLYQGSDDILRARIDEGTQAAGWNPMQGFRNIRQRRQNIRNIEEQAYQAGRSGGTSVPTLRASDQPVTSAETAVNAATAENARVEAILQQNRQLAQRNQQQVDAATQAQRQGIETSEQALNQAEQNYNTALEGYYQSSYGRKPPVGQNSVELYESEVTRLESQLRSSPGDATITSQLEAARGNLEVAQRHQAASQYTSRPGLTEREVNRLGRLDESQLASEIAGLEQELSTTGRLSPGKQNKLDFLREHSSSDTGQLTRDRAQLMALFNSGMRGPERELLGLPRSTQELGALSGDEIASMAEQGLAVLKQSDPSNPLVARLEAQLTPRYNINRDSLTAALEEHSRGLAYQKGPGQANTALEGARGDLTAAQEALQSAEQTVSRQRSRLERLRAGEQRLISRQDQLNAELASRQERLTAATEARTQTQTALNAPVLSRARTNNLDNLAAPVNEALVKSKAKPEVLEALQLRGLDGISPEMAEQLSILQSSGVDTAKLINNAAKRSGLPKAVKQVNKAADNLVNEAIAASGNQLNPEQLEIIQGVVKDFGTRGEQLKAANLQAALRSGGTGGLPTEVTAVLSQVESLAASGAGVGAEFTNATRNLGEVFAGGEKSFGTQLGNEFSRAQGIAADAGYANLRKGVQGASEDPGFFKRLFTNKPRGLKGEDLEAIEAVEALTNARIQAMESAIAGQGGNAALVQAARPQMYEASAAVARSGNPDIARAWSRVLQEPGNLQANIANKPQLQAFLEAEAPELMSAARQNSRAFNLGVDQAEQLSNLIPKGGRGSAENLARELEKGFSKETFRDLSSPRAQESLVAMQSADATFATNMRALLKSGDEVANSAANKVLSGTRNAGEFTVAELSQLTGVNAPNITDRGVIGAVITDTAKATAAEAELTRIAGSSADKSTKDILKQIDDDIARLKKDQGRKATKGKKGASPADPRIGALQDARRVVESEQSRVQSELTSNYTTHMSTSRRNLETTIKADSRVDMTKLKRNTEVGKVKVESTTFDELYQQPVLNAEGAVEFTPANIEKQFEQLKSLRQNGNTSDEVVLARIIEENLARLKAQGVTDPQQLNSARANLEAIVGGLESKATPEAIRAAAGKGGMGATGNLATGAAVVGGTGYAASRPGPSPATTARAGTMQPRASWGLSPLQAPVRYIKKTAMSAPTAIQVPKPKFTPNDVTKAPVKHTSIPATSLMTATTDSISKISMLQAPIRAW